MPPLASVYCLTVGGGALDGWPGLYYAVQRGIAESILSLVLIERYFAAAKGAGIFNAATFHLIGDASFPVFTVPEPGTAGLLAGIGALGLMRRRRK